MQMSRSADVEVWLRAPALLPELHRSPKLQRQPAFSSPYQPLAQNERPRAESPGAFYLFQKLLLSSLEARLHRCADALEDTLHICSMGTVGSQFEILLISLDATRGSHNLLRLGIDGSLRNQRLSLNVISICLLRICRDCFVGSGPRLGQFACVVEDCSFVVKVHSGLFRLSLGSLIVGVGRCLG